MSGALARTALRLASIEALCADPVIGPACAGRVYDSLIGSFEGDDPVPVIVVTTEDDQGDDYSINNGGPPFNQAVDLTFEITVCTQVPGDDDIDIFIPATTRELESLLDLLEYQAVQAVTVADTPQSRVVRQAVTRRVTRYRSARFTSEGTGVKLARRLVTLTAWLKGDDDADALAPPTGPFAALPDPLRTVAASLPAGSSGLATVSALVAKLTAPAAAQAFTGIDAIFAPQSLDPATPPNPADPNASTIGLAMDLL